MAVTFCTSGSCFLMAGKGMSGDFFGAGNTPPNGFSTQTAAVEELIRQAEDFLNAAIADEDSDFINNYSTLDSNKKLIFEEGTARLVGMDITKYDTSGYPSSSVAQFITDVNQSRVDDIIKLLKKKKTSDFVKGA